MIKSVHSDTSNWLTVSSYGSSSGIYVDSYKLQQGIAGQVRYNGQDFEVNDGNGWKVLYSGQATINMSHQSQDAFQWVIRQMAREREAEQLAKDNPAVKIALDNLERARQQLNATILLSKEHDQTTTS
jgi:hypothetical protein